MLEVFIVYLKIERLFRHAKQVAKARVNGFQLGAAECLVVVVVERIRFEFPNADQVVGRKRVFEERHNASLLGRCERLKQCRQRRC